MPVNPPSRPGPARRSDLPTSVVTCYRKPPLSLFNRPTPGKPQGNRADLAKQAAILVGKLHDFGVDGAVVQVLPGPVVTMYEFAPASGIKVSRIVNLADDLALGMRALSVRIVAPVPGKSVVGIEVPNPRRQPVYLHDIVASPAFRQATSKLVLALGKDILGTPTVTDLAQIPHLLIAGATGSGKSVGLNSMICSMLLNATPEEVKFIMIDPKMLELSVYDGIPHLIAPVVTHPKKAAAALHWAVEEMERRYRLLAEYGVRSLDGYNQTHPDSRLPYLVVVIDELADLMLVARRDVEEALTRLAQMARASGIHLLVATQRPSVDVLTGIIKANFPARLSFQVTSRTDSRTILDAIGAERLLGKGDMLFLPPGTSKLVRIHGAYVSETEIKRVVDYLRYAASPGLRWVNVHLPIGRQHRTRGRATTNMMRPWPWWPDSDKRRRHSCNGTCALVITGRPAYWKPWSGKAWWVQPTAAGRVTSIARTSLPHPCVRSPCAAAHRVVPEGHQRGGLCIWGRWRSRLITGGHRSAGRATLTPCERCLWTVAVSSRVRDVYADL